MGLKTGGVQGGNTQTKLRMIDGVLRTLIGTIVHVLALCYFGLFPLAVLIVLAVDPESMPKMLGSWSWVTMLNFGLMLFLSLAIAYGLFRPLEKAIRTTAGYILIGISILTAINLTYTIIMVEELDGLFVSICNLCFLAALATGFMMGYEAKAASYLMPFRFKDPKGGVTNSGDSP